MPFAANKFEKTNTENQTVDWSHYAKNRRSFFIPKIKKEIDYNGKNENP